MKQLTREESIALYDSGAWRDWDDKTIAEFQMLQEFLCIPFGRFHEAVEKRLGRPVWTHEFAFKDNLIAEMFYGTPKPTMEDIINLIPVDKQVIVLTA